MKDILRIFIREQIAVADLLHAKQFNHNYNDPPFSVDDYTGYKYDIISDVNQGYLLTITYNGKKIKNTMLFQDYEEALHNAKNIISKLKIKQEHGKKKKKERTFGI